MRLALYRLILGALAGLSFVSGLRNVTLDDNDPAIVYSLGWNVSHGNNSLDFGGSLHFSDNATASASLTFRGVAVYLIAPFWSSSVGAQVAIDAQRPFVIDLEDHGVPAAPGLGKETLLSQVVWAATGLPDTEHTIVISLPPAMRHVVLDGLIYSVLEGNNAESISTVVSTSTSFRFTTTTTTRLSTSSPASSSSIFSSISSSFVQSTTASSSQLSSSSKLSPSLTSQSPDDPINVGTLPPSSAAAATVSASAAKVLSASAKRSIAISSVFGATMLLLAILVLLTCVRRRRMRQRRQRLNNWSQKFTPFSPYPPHTAATRAAGVPPSSEVNSSRPSLEYRQAPATAAAGAIVPSVPPGRRMPRSPLATAPPIMSPPSLPTPAQFPGPATPASAPLISPALMRPALTSPTLISPSLTSPVPMSPAPTTPLPPTPGASWSRQKSHRLSTSSAYSHASSPPELRAGYGWATQSLVGIHPFSAPEQPEPSASHSVMPRPAAALAPQLDEKTATAFFRDEDALRTSVAPVYREKDATRLFAGGRSRAGSQASEVAPPVYEP